MKTALITGAAQGIGAAIASTLLQSGYRVIVSDIQIAKGQDTAATLGANAHFVPLDVRREDHWEQAMQFINDRWGAPSVVVNNAGISGMQQPYQPMDPEHISSALWQQVHDVNLNGTFLGCRYAIRSMKGNDHHSAIINISSRSGMVGVPFGSAYASSKAAVRNHTKSVARYCAAQGYPITCNSIHPGAILTPMWEPMLAMSPDRDAALRQLCADVPLQRMGTPAEVAALVAFLCTDTAAYITGSEFAADGGIMAGTSATPAR